MRQLISTVLEAERPQLIVLSGDAISGAFWDGSEGWVERRAWGPLSALLAAHAIPYATILGNHCAEADLTRRQICDLDARLGGDLSLTRSSPENETSGASSYWLDVMTGGGPPGGGAAAVVSGEDGEEAAARIWLLDSMRRTCEGARGW
jgi:hypothetical protein